MRNYTSVIDKAQLAKLCMQNCSNAQLAYNRNGKSMLKAREKSKNLQNRDQKKKRNYRLGQKTQ